MSPDVTDPPLAALIRPPDQVMRLERLGAAFQTRLSFMRSLIRRLHDERWSIRRSLARLDAAGYGVAVYQAKGPARTYSLVAFSHALDPAKRTDRVIAEAWDATFVLFDGVPGEADIARLAGQTPKQEAGRFTPRELVLSRANKSVRLFDHIVDRLAAGRQPDRDMLMAVGYLMRTTAVYGNGKFGIADRAKYADRAELAGPFQAEMLNVYLIRCFTLDLVAHVARARARNRAVELSRTARRYLGIGNATGLGMAPFLVNHPILIHNWIWARERAFARVRAVGDPRPDRRARFAAVLDRARDFVAEWRVGDQIQTARITRLRADLAAIAAWFGQDAGAGALWDRLYRRAEAELSVEAQEMLLSLMTEPYGDLVDDLSAEMSTDARRRIEPDAALGEIGTLLETHYGWALGIDFAPAAANRFFWYVSAEKLEPRLGERDQEPGADKEMPLAVGRDVQALAAALAERAHDQPVAALLEARPDLRHIVRRVQTLARHPYGEIRDNLIGQGLRPIDLLRCKLSFFGAAKFDPKSDRWTRITLYQGAPLPDELDRADADDWCFATWNHAAAA